jgi:hypothetical protein
MPAEDDVEATSDACVKVGGYSVHVATAMMAHERERMVKLPDRPSPELDVPNASSSQPTPPRKNKRMSLVGLVCDSPTIHTTLTALGKRPNVRGMGA